MTAQASLQMAPVAAAAPKSRSIAIGDIALAGVIAVGVLLRLQGSGRSFWVDEAWVANSVVADNLHGMFYYPHWLQVTPPLFLLLARWTVMIAGLSEASLRAVPLTFEIVSLVVFAWLSRRMFQMPLAVLPVALLAISPDVITYSRYFKHFGTDIAASCLVMAALWWYFENANRVRFCALLLVLAFALALSYTSVMFVPAALAVALMAGQTRRKYLRPLLLLAFCSAFYAAIYLLFIRPNSEPQLKAFWIANFPNTGSISEWARLYRYWMAEVVLLLYRPWRHQRAVSLVFLALSLLGLTALAVGAMKRSRYAVMVLLCAAAPIATLLVVNLLGLYPLETSRLSLFIVPCLAILVMAGLDVLWRALRRNRFFGEFEGVTTIVVVALCGLSVVALGVRRIIERSVPGYKADLVEDASGAIGFLRNHVVPNDLVYVHASMDEPARFYWRILNWSPPELETGATGWGCCPRGLPLAVRDANDRSVLADLGSRIEKHRASRVWIVCLRRPSHWKRWGRDEHEIILANLQQLSCRLDSTNSFTNVSVDFLDCR